MPRHRQRLDTADATPEPSSLSLTDGSLEAVQIRRLAELIAEGRSCVPADLSPSEQQRLSEEVRGLLRSRLVRFIARAIALNLRRAAGPREDKPCSDVNSIRSDP
jgi:hypothetical protein